MSEQLISFGGEGMLVEEGKRLKRVGKKQRGTFVLKRKWSKITSKGYEITSERGDITSKQKKPSR